MSIILYKECDYRHRKKKWPTEFKQLITSINALPGINVSSGTFATFSEKSNIVYNKPLIFFRVDHRDNSGLFFLTRCVDRRYWKHGEDWNINLSVGDIMGIDGNRPINYELTPNNNVNLNDIIKQISSLVDNMNYHLHHINFMAAYNLHIYNFSTIDTVVENRVDTINSIFS